MKKYVIGLFEPEYELLLFALGVATAGPKLSRETRSALLELTKQVVMADEIEEESEPKG